MATKKFTIRRSPAPEGAPKVKGPSSALAAVLTMTFAHTAEVFEVFATAVSEHYGIDREEMFGVIRAHPSWEAIQLHPALKDLGYLPSDAPAAEPPSEAPVPAAAEPAPAAAAPAASLSPKKKTFIIKKTPPGSVA